MKTMKTILTSLYLVGLLFATSVHAADVENTVKYGEKYVCDIQTVDGKNYSLDLEWSTEPATYSKFPKWHNVLIYNLKEGEHGIDRGYFSNIGFYSDSLNFTFNWNSYLFVGTEAHPTRVGENFSTINIKIAKNYDKNAKTNLSVESFKSVSERSYYRLYENKTVELAIQSSLCNVVQASKE